MRIYPGHPDESDAHEVALDRLSPTPAHVLQFRTHTDDRCGAVAALSTSDQHWLYRGRLVVVRGPMDAERRGFVEAALDEEVLVRWL
jgi:hypothetical protein